MRKLPLRVAAVPMPLWKWDWAVYQGTPNARLTADLKRLGIDSPPEEWAMGHTWVYAGMPVVIWVDRASNIPCLAHEVMHGVAGMLEARGLKPCHESEEAYTYTVEYVLRYLLSTPRVWQAVR
jgi:hypothetical protein